MNSIKRHMRYETLRSLPEKAVASFIALTPEQQSEFVTTINRIYQRPVMTFNENKK